MLNKIIISGRIIKAPEMRQAGETPVCNFTIACERDFPNKQSGERESDFVDVTAWNHTADFISKYFNKGSLIMVVGRLQRRSYTDKDDKKRYVFEVVAESVYFCGDKNSQKEDSDKSQRSESANATSSRKGNYVEANDPDGDLPF